jgi:hypothetical protein
MSWSVPEMTVWLILTTEPSSSICKKQNYIF